MNRMKWQIVALAMMLAFLANTPAVLAREAAVFVTLPRQIRAEYKGILRRSIAAESAAQELEAQIKQVVRQIESTMDYDDKLRLREKYLLYCAKSLEVAVELVLENKKALVRTGDLFEQLEKAVPNWDNVFYNMAYDNSFEKHVMTKVSSGMAKMMEIIEARYPQSDANLSEARQTIETMRALTQDYFDKRHRHIALQELEERKTYVITMAEKTQVVLKLIEWWIADLKFRNVPVVCGDPETMPKLDEVFGDDLSDLALTMKEHHPADKQVLKVVPIRGWDKWFDPQR